MQITFWTSIKPQLLKKVLLQGTAVAACGALILVLGSILISKKTLEIWGIYLFIFSSLLMAVGLIPYRRLQKLETNPNKISLKENGYLHYEKNGKLFLSIPIQQIQSLDWLEKSTFYGIRLHLKNGQSKILPFFSKRSFEEIKEFLQTSATT